MTTSTAKLNYLRLAPRKMRLIADLVRGKTVSEAENILKFTVTKSAAVLLKLLNSAVANAKHNAKADEKKLFISKLTVDQGPMLKRSMPRSRGSAFPIQKKLSHVYLELSLAEENIKKAKKK